MLRDKVRIGAMVFEVVEVDRLTDSSNTNTLWGSVSAGTAKIEIERQNCRQQRTMTLLHEIIHIVLHQAGQEEFAANESLVSALSYGIGQVMVDNPWISELLRSGFDEAQENNDHE